MIGGIVTGFDVVEVLEIGFEVEGRRDSGDEGADLTVDGGEEGTTLSLSLSSLSLSSFSPIVNIDAAADTVFLSSDLLAEAWAAIDAKFAAFCCN